ncbi:MAG: flagellar hook-basal body complex protein FliE [Dorea sp.]|jgi:flagellar hook-basal body complex protein FliE|nr:flagellar hook-basal body complex protein FliE [Dorea sp.]
MGELFITPLQPWSLGDISGSEKVVKGEEGIAAFKSVFEEAINDVRKTEDTLAKNQYLLATGQIEDPHTVSIASSEAQLASDVLVSLRNKALESYNEIMRINL